MAQTHKKQHVVVSMTSFPAAISYAAKAIRSLLDGSVLPDRLILYITASQFTDTAVLDELVALSESNPIFEIRNYDRDIRSYRKLIPALIDFPDSVIVTVDDDVRYHKNMLRDLLRWHEVLPDAVLAHRAKRIKVGEPYRKWSKYRWYDFLLKRVHISYLTMQTGVGGVLYPPHALRADMLDADIFTKLAPTTDDIWFWGAAAANSVRVVPIPFGHNKPQGLSKPKSLSLKTENFKCPTDKNLAALQTVLETYPEIKERLQSEK